MSQHHLLQLLELNAVPDYAIGDVQGCYDPLMRLLDCIDFNDKSDRLWFVGDLVNRGPHSLAVLRFIKTLALTPRISLGNHDLHLLSVLFTKNPWQGKDDTIAEIVEAPDGVELGHWLRKQPVLCYSAELHLVMTHAGIAPLWDLPQAMLLAKELEQVLIGENYVEFLTHMYGNKPKRWVEALTGIQRLRAITNYFTRMRFCDQLGGLAFKHKEALKCAPSSLYPWYATPKRKEIEVDIIFGHWAALQGVCSYPKIYPLDTGCVWGGKLTALRLQDKQRFSVAGLSR